jgi:hypothetical protein
MRRLCELPGASEFFRVMKCVAARVGAGGCG